MKDFHGDDGIVAILGAWRSSRSIPAASINGKLGMPQISFGSTASKLSDKTAYPSKNVFRAGYALCCILHVLEFFWGSFLAFGVDHAIFSMNIPFKTSEILRTSFL